MPAIPLSKTIGGESIVPYFSSLPSQNQPDLIELPYLSHAFFRQSHYDRKAFEIH